MGSVQEFNFATRGARPVSNLEKLGLDPTVSSHFDGQRVLVTGATGFIGQHVVRTLRQCPRVSIRVLARTWDRVHELFGAAELDSLEVRLGDLTDPASLTGVCDGVDIVIHAGSVVGSDGFGYAEERGERVKIPQLGNVVIEEDVEIGSNVTLDRATFGTTWIRKGTKIDNLVQVGHNCDVGENSVLVAQVGLSGSVRVGRGVIFAGQSGSVGHVSIGDGTRVGAKSAVTTDLPAGSFVIGHPARDHREWKRTQALLARLPELRKRLDRIERTLEELAGGKARRES